MILEAENLELRQRAERAEALAQEALRRTEILGNQARRVLAAQEEITKKVEEKEAMDQPDVIVIGDGSSEAGTVGAEQLRESKMKEEMLANKDPQQAGYGSGYAPSGGR